MTTRLSHTLNSRKSTAPISSRNKKTSASNNKRTTSDADVTIDDFNTPPSKRVKQQSSDSTAATSSKPHHQQLKQLASSLVKQNLLVPSAWEHLDDNEIILRQFDMKMEYGPCSGISRMKRWQRAEKLGLNPPVAIRDLLLKQQAGQLRVNPMSAWQNIAKRVLVEQGWMKNEDDKLTIKQHFTARPTSKKLTA